MLNFSSRTKYFISSSPTDMREGHEGLADIVRMHMEHNPLDYNEAFIFYSKDYRKVKVLHYDINRWVLYSKWFTDGRFHKPRFEECKRCYEMSCETLILILSTSVQTNIRDATRFLNDEIDPNTPYLNESPISDVIKHVMRLTDGLTRDVVSESSPQKNDKACHVPSKKRSKASKEDAARILRSRRQYNASMLERIGIDTSNLPDGAKLIRRNRFKVQSESQRESYHRDA